MRPLRPVLLPVLEFHHSQVDAQPFHHAARLAFAVRQVGFAAPEIGEVGHSTPKAFLSVATARPSVTMSVVGVSEVASRYFLCQYIAIKRAVL